MTSVVKLQLDLDDGRFTRITRGQSAASVGACASAGIGQPRLSGATLYVTVEPCLMCVGAMVHARIGTVVYGAPEPRTGAIESTQRAHAHPSLNHRLTVVSGVLARECRDRIREFFKNKR